MAGHGGAGARRKIDGRAARGRNSRGGGQSRRRGQEARGYTSDGRGQQGFRPLPLVGQRSGANTRRGETIVGRRVGQETDAAEAAAAAAASEVSRWRVKLPYKMCAISASWRISTPARPPLPSGCCTTPGSTTRSAKCTK